MSRFKGRLVRLRPFDWGRPQRKPKSRPIGIVLAPPKSAPIYGSLTELDGYGPYWEVHREHERRRHPMSSHQKVILVYWPHDKSQEWIPMQELEFLDNSL